MDILAALEATTPVATGRRCAIARWLDSIPADTAGRDALVATFAQPDKNGPHYRRLSDLSHLAGVLGFTVGTKTIMLHRNKDCACFGRSA